MHVAGEIVRAASRRTPHAADDDVGQPRDLWEQVLSDTDRDHLVGNVVDHATQGVDKDIQDRVVDHWATAHPDLGGRVATGLHG